MSEQDSMVEKLARAMHAELTTQDYTGDYAHAPRLYRPGTNVTLDGTFDLHAVARAVIAALRGNPPEAVLLPISELSYSYSEHGEHDFGGAHTAWQAAIDACLQEQT